MAPASATPISQAEFARILGVTPPAVGKAIKSGRLKRCLVTGEDGKPKIADVELAKREWRAATDLSRAPGYVKERAEAREAPPPRPAVPPPLPRAPLAAAPPPGAPPLEDLSLSGESAREKHWKANKAELEYRERIGQLVDAEEMQAQVADAFTRVRSRLAGLPTRVRQQIPHLTTDEVGIIEAFVREALEELALQLESDADDDGDEPSGA